MKRRNVWFHAMILSSVIVFAGCGAASKEGSNADTNQQIEEKEALKEANTESSMAMGEESFSSDNEDEDTNNENESATNGDLGEYKISQLINNKETSDFFLGLSDTEKQQLDFLYEHCDWMKGLADEDIRYAICDLNDNGKLEMVVSGKLHDNAENPIFEVYEVDLVNETYNKLVVESNIHPLPDLSLVGTLTYYFSGDDSFYEFQDSFTKDTSEYTGWVSLYVGDSIEFTHLGSVLHTADSDVFMNRYFDEVDSLDEVQELIDEHNNGYNSKEISIGWDSFDGDGLGEKMIESYQTFSKSL